MQWNADGNSWVRTQRRRTRWAFAGAVVAPLVVVGSLGAIAFVSRGSVRGAMLDIMVGWAFFMILGGTVLWTLFGLRAAVRERQVLRRVPVHDAAICVRCRQALPRNRSRRRSHVCNADRG